MSRRRRLVLLLGPLAVALLALLALVLDRQETPAPLVARAAATQPGSVVRAAAPLPVTSASVPIAQATPSACGEEYQRGTNGLCVPVDLDKNRPYTAEELDRFDQMRASSFVGSRNFFVPQVLPPEEVERRRAQFARMNALAEKVRKRAATEAEIDELFRFRERIVNYRMQLVAFAHAEAGGIISTADPSLDPDRITEPALLEQYRAIEAERLRDYEHRKRARLEHGLPAEALSGPNSLGTVPL